MNRTKYVRTKNGEIIVFAESIVHSTFLDLKPTSAGFISFGVNKEGQPSCQCYGESISLGLKSNEEEDTWLAERQILKKAY